MKVEKTILYIALMLLALNFISKQCTKSKDIEPPKITVVRDTVWQTKTDTFTLQTTAYKTVYVHPENVDDIVEDTSKVLNFDTYKEARVYRDTLVNEDIELFSYNLVEGQLLDSKLTYNLKIPREITITKTIEYPKTYRSGLYMFSEFGGNTNQVNNLSLGLQYNRKGKWFVSYRTNFNTIEQTSHHLGVGFRLFK